MSVFRVGSNKSSINNFPSVRPTLDLDFANSKTLDPRITFTRSSGGSYVGADGLIKLAGVNEARFDHDPYTGESLGFLVEEGRSNLYVFSENPESAFFQPEIVSFSSNSAIAPDGNLTADKIISPVGAVGGPSISQGINITSGATLTGSVFVKYADLDRLEIVLLSNNNTTPYARATINPINGTITVAVTAFNGGTNPSASVVSYPNGWYRFSVTVTYPAVTLAGMRVTASDSGGALGDGIMGTFVWGAQLEQGSFPTSYIPTQASTRTRAADNASITGKNFSEWYRQDEGTFITKAKYDGFPIIALVNRTSFATISTEGTIASWNVWWETANYAAYVVENPQLTYQAVLVSGFISINQTKKTASAYKLNDFAFTANGASPSLDTLGTVPSTIRLFIGSLNGNSWCLNGTISRLTYYPKRLPNAQLQALTK